MKMDSSVKYFWKYPDEEFTIEFSFENNIASGDSLSTANVTITDDEGTDHTSTMIDSVSVSSPYVYFDISGGTSDVTYNIKIKATTTQGKTLLSYVKCEVFGGVTLTTYIGGSTSNSYVTLTEANKYIRSKYKHSSLWDTLSEEGKKRVLIEAARIIDTFNYNGDKYYDSQALQFPRDDHETVTGNPATPITATSFYHTSLYSTTYGVYPDNYWKYGTCHITEGTPLYDIRQIVSSDSTNGKIVVSPSFSATPTTNTGFIIFAPINKRIKDAQCEQAEFIVRNANLDDLISYKEIGARVIRIGDTRVDFDTGSTTKLPISPIAKKLVSQFIRKRQRYARA